MYDFSQPEGHFSVGWGWKNFLWRLEDGKYYLDEETFNRIPAGFFQRDRKGELSYGYTDLILTAEAIKHEAWKLLSYRGLDHLGYFMKDFPDSKQRYEQAVWDSHTSLAAKNRGMTVTELLRLRLSSSTATDQEVVK